MTIAFIIAYLFGAVCFMVWRAGFNDFRPAHTLPSLLCVAAFVCVAWPVLWYLMIRNLIEKAME